MHLSLWDDTHSGKREDGFFFTCVGEAAAKKNLPLTHLKTSSALFVHHCIVRF